MSTVESAYDIDTHQAETHSYDRLSAFIPRYLPLVFATGAGSASRNSLGTAVFGGMLVSTFLSIEFLSRSFMSSSENIREQGFKKVFRSEQVRRTLVMKGFPLISIEIGDSIKGSIQGSRARLYIG
jgi:hypothetical protein